MFGRLKPFNGVQFVKETLQCPVLEETGVCIFFFM
jgi:hypothetical protein